MTTKFGCYTVLHETTKRGKQRYVMCCCQCGTQKEVRLSHLKSGKIVSCGCFIKNKLSTQNGESNTRLYKIWVNMVDRCNNSKSQSYANYGGRGIIVDSNWIDYNNFKDWALSSGYTADLTIERTNVDLGYIPSNCVWVSKSMQSVNKRKKQNTLSRYIGVFPINNRFRAAANYKGKAYYIGIFDTEVEAAKARDQFIRDNGWPHKLNF